MLKENCRLKLSSPVNQEVIVYVCSFPGVSIRSKDSKELNRKIKVGFVPIVRNVPGFAAYYWFDTGNGVGASLDVFEDKAGAEESVRAAADFVKRELASILGSRPEILQGTGEANG